MEELLKIASDLVGREVEVEKTKDGKYIVLFMSLTDSPPPKANTEEEALNAFIEWARAREQRALPEFKDIIDEDFEA
jgi:hypothetical protein